MKRILMAFFVYGALALIATAIHATTNFGGALGCIISIIGIVLSRTIVFLLLSFLNFSLSIAFDNFLRVDQFFYFYKGDASEVVVLSLVSTLIFCVIGFLDMTRQRGSQRKLLINFEPPIISRSMFLPCMISIAATTAFIINKESFVLSDSYDAYELRKYPFLEYVSLVIAFMLLSASRHSKWAQRLSYGITFFFVLTMFATSYRMVGIICALSAMMITFNKRKLSKLFLVIGWLSSYVILMYISYWRIGHFEVSVDNLLGYVNGRLDNTFTGVIETAMVYIQIGKSQSMGQNLGFLLGALLPIPNAFIPDDLIYILDAKENHSFPGGGALGGFFIYFNYLLAIPYFIYFFIAFKNSFRPGVASGMYLIISITITRWWLYGPYVLFKFLGIFTILLIANKLAAELGAAVRNKRMLRGHLDKNALIAHSGETL